MRAPDWISPDGSIRLYNADACELLPEIQESFDCVITDPVWPNSTPELPGADAPWPLFAAAAAHFPRLAQRAIIHLGCNSDPRFLCGMPPEMPFLRVCWLRYVRPSYQGRLLNGADVAYIFGAWPPSRKGAMVLPGESLSRETNKRAIGHPCPRRLMHVLWLTTKYARGAVLDPFMGSGTTAIAAYRCGLPFVGIEISSEYFATAISRIEAEIIGTMQFNVNYGNT